MIKILSAIGLSSIIDRKIKFNRMLRDAFISPDYNSKLRNAQAGRTQVESYKSLGDGFGVIVYGERYIKVNRQGEKNQQSDIKGWGLFALSDDPIEIADFYVDCEDEGREYAFCEDKITGNLFEFKINNLLEYKKRSKKGEAVSSVNIAMLALFGTIILPVYKDEYTNEYRNEENRMHRELLEKARSGDNTAEEALNRKASKIAETVWERMKNEDILSIFEGYFLLIGNHSPSFSVLADIEKVEHLTNDLTNENVVKLLLDISGTKLNLFVNEKDLVGMPIAGMRFMGVGMLQGSAIFAD